MNWISQAQCSKSFRLAVIAVGLVSLVTAFMAWLPIRHESQIDLEDIDRRAVAISHRITSLARDVLEHPGSLLTENQRDQLDGYRSFVGFSVAKADGPVVAAGRGVSDLDPQLLAPASARTVSRTCSNRKCPFPHPDSTGFLRT